ncbi:hypothetical protein [Microbulbifer halophilus]|uniref:hypothetical protein n=1 Tax=Microbulbifer halophilus TaxID=453963 RepID=UPI00361D69EF
MAHFTIELYTIGFQTLPVRHDKSVVFIGSGYPITVGTLYILEQNLAAFSFPVSSCQGNIPIRTQVILATIAIHFGNIPEGNITNVHLFGITARLEGVIVARPSEKNRIRNTGVDFQGINASHGNSIGGIEISVVVIPIQGYIACQCYQRHFPAVPVQFFQATKTDFREFETVFTCYFINPRRTITFQSGDNSGIDTGKVDISGTQMIVSIFH